MCQRHKLVELLHILANAEQIDEALEVVGDEKAPLLLVTLTEAVIRSQEPRVDGWEGVTAECAVGVARAKVLAFGIPYVLVGVGAVQEEL